MLRMFESQVHPILASKIPNISGLYCSINLSISGFFVIKVEFPLFQQRNLPFSPFLANKSLEMFFADLLGPESSLSVLIGVVISRFPSILTGMGCDNPSQVLRYLGVWLLKAEEPSPDPKGRIKPPSILGLTSATVLPILGY